MKLLDVHLEISTGFQMSPVSEELSTYDWLNDVFRMVGCDMPALHGVTAEEAVPDLERGVLNLKGLELTILQAYSQQAYDRANTFLSRLLDDCKDHPKARLCVQN